MTGGLRVSVIIPAYNADATIDDCLGALERQTVPRESYEVLVVDDGSADNTCPRVQAHDGVRLLTQVHAGPAAARNLGAAEAQGDFLLFTDSDCVPAQDWVERMLAPFHDDSVAGVKGAYLTHQQEIVARFVQIEYEDKYVRMAREESIDFVDTYAAGYRRHVFLSSGGFDTTFPLASVEDQEFSFRLAGHGYKMVFVPQARVYHLGHAQTVGSYWRKKFKIGYWKVLVTSRHPAKALRDSHTPQTLKVQILLVGLGLVCILGSLLWQPLLTAIGILALVFLLTTIPFALGAWRRDRAVALISPGLLLVRALALGLGFAVGLAAHSGSGGAVEKKAMSKAPSRSEDLFFVDIGEPAIQGSRAFFKRVIDILGALISILLFAPLMIVAALLIKLDSPGPVLFIQERVGDKGMTFKILKLRTMVRNAEELLDEMLDLDQLEEPVFKIRDDPRVTPVGRFLRRWSIDELPQLFNVLQGDMSLVGPRPEEVRVVRYYDGWQRQRLLAKPGITGPVQISGRGDLSLEDRVRLEVDYIRHYAPRRDLEILLKTIPAVIRGDGSY